MVICYKCVVTDRDKPARDAFLCPYNRTLPEIVGTSLPEGLPPCGCPFSAQVKNLNIEFL
ncbi:hypothetical protein KKE26_07085 [bacterium]|nr:hypothetical protein [bacterium]